ncbi:MAG: hypothetical protein AAGI17_05220 [Planctomycetota bacterium]
MRKTATCAVVAAVAGSALAQPINGFTETFENGLAGWDPSGGLSIVLNSESGNSFVSVSGLLPTSPFGGATVFGGDAGGATDGFSGGAFIGDYVAAGITTISFDIRHNAANDLSFSVRLPTFNNSPANIVFGPSLAASNEFTTISFNIDPNNPALVPTGGPAGLTATAIQNVQLLVGGGDVQGTIDIDNVTITPAPSGALALCGAGLVAARRRRR